MIPFSVFLLLSIQEPIDPVQSMSKHTSRDVDVFLPEDMGYGLVVFVSPFFNLDAFFNCRELLVFFVIGRVNVE